jgi:hypothetical protein
MYKTNGVTSNVQVVGVLQRNVCVIKLFKSGNCSKEALGGVITQFRSSYVE